MFKFFSFFFFLTLHLLASNYSFHVDTFAGYRNDTMKDKFNILPTGDLVAQFDFHSLNSVVFGQQADLYLYNFLLRYHVDFTWIQGGKADIEFPIEFESGSFSSTYEAKVRGNNYDVLGFVGYQIDLYKTNSFNLFLTPLTGYGLIHQTLRCKNIQPDTLDLPQEVLSTGITSAQLITQVNPLNRNWWGPNLGADLGFINEKRFTLIGGYSYNWLKLSSDQANSLLLTATAPGLFLSILNETFVNFRSKGGHGHWVRGDLSFNATDHWSLGLKGWYFHAFIQDQISTNNRSTSTVPGQEGTFIIPEVDQFESKWQTYSITFESIFHY